MTKREKVYLEFLLVRSLVEGDGLFDVKKFGDDWHKQL